MAQDRVDAGDGIINSRFGSLCLALLEIVLVIVSAGNRDEAAQIFEPLTPRFNVSVVPLGSSTKNCPVLGR